MLLDYAKAELERVDLEYDGMVKEAVLEIVKLFAGQGHSGGSAAITLAVAEKLLRFQPLTPLTGDNDEWTEVTEGTWQNKRCPSVFKDTDKAWDINLPPEDDGDGGKGWQTITFPYTPGREPFDRRAAQISGEQG